MARNQFASKLGLLAATVGSAVGLGNIWRFPAETADNGGAAFLLLYIVCIAVLGIPVMLAEFALGRAGRSDSVGVFRKIAPGTKWWIVGIVSVVAPFMINAYYFVVEGWTFEYLISSITGNLFEPIEGATTNSEIFAAHMQQYIASPWMPILATWAVIFINMFVLLGGVSKGIERLSNIMMPTLFVVLLVLCSVALSLPDAGAGVEWFLAPDFSKITFPAVISALGQAFFSLSLGMGILVTYASYYPKDARLTRTSVVVVASSLLVALLVGLVIFPAMSATGLQDQALRGTTLVFRTLPEVFALMPATGFCAILFFLLLFAAALTSTVSLLEVTVAFLVERLNLSRRAAVLWTTLPLLPLSAVCSLSFSTMEHVTIFGMTIFELLDYITSNYLLPLVAISVCIFVGWVAPRSLLRDQLSNHGSLRCRIATPVELVVRYLAPALVLLILVWNLVRNG